MTQPQGVLDGVGHRPAVPALVHGYVTHSRRTPLRHGFRYRVFLWLVDVDRLPALPWYLRAFTTFRAADHLGRPDRTLRENVDHLLARHGLDLGPGSTILMLANARVLGHVFDPLSVFWCFDRAGALRCVVAEVHNTYGERHAYLLRPDADGQAVTDKQFYVSPFNDLSGQYELRFGLTATSVSTSVVLLRDARLVFSATFAGHCTPATPSNVLRAQLRHPFMTHRVSALIRLHGVVLWFRRLPVVPRPTHRAQEGV